MSDSVDTLRASEDDAPPAWRSVVFAVLLAALLCGGFQLRFAHENLNLRDEGYLYYGVRQVLLGDVPFRDFQAYDPGRYYWCALLSPLFGDGLVGMRWSIGLFAAIGIACGLLVARRAFRSDLWMIPIGVVLLLLAFPRHKLFEQTIVAATMLAVVRLLERPSPRRYFALGVVVGLSAFFGRNHGVYGLVACALTVALCWTRGERPTIRELGLGSLGIVVGYAPQLVMLATIPGYPAAFVDAVFSVLDRGANIPADYRWPWLAPHDELAGALALDVMYLLPVIVLPLGLFLAFRRRVEPRRIPLAGASIAGIAFAHHYYVRADLPHLAQAYPPVLVATLALLAFVGARTLVKAASLGALLVVAVLTAFEGNAELKDFAPGAEEEGRLERIDVEILATGDTLSLRKNQGIFVLRMQRLALLRAGDEPMFIAPTMPMWYPVLGKRTPVWWIYHLWPASEEEQDEILRRLDEAKVNWALISFWSFNEDPAYDFDRTNPKVWDELETNWSRVVDADTPPQYVLFKRREEL